MKTIPKPSDRIRLIAMPDEPHPVPAGSIGTVVGVEQIGTGRDAWFQVDVDWDNERMLMLSMPPDEIVVLD